MKTVCKRLALGLVCSMQMACFGAGGGGSDSNLSFIFALLGTGGASVTSEEATNDGPKPIAIEVRQNGNLISSGGDYDFGGRVNNTNGPNVDFVVKNVGTEAIAFSGSTIQIAETDFFITQDSISSLAAGAEHTVTVSFRPKTLGLRSSTLRVVGPNNTSAYSISVYGNSTATAEPEIKVQETTNLLSGSEYSFGSLEEDSIGSERTLKISNVGSASLNFTNGASAVQITGTNASDFEIVSQPSSSLTEGATTEFKLRFKPSATIGRANTSKTASLSILNNDTDEGNFQLSLVGVSTPKPIPEITITQNGNPIISGSTYDFGSIQEFTTGSNITFTIHNEGQANLILSGGPNFLFKSGTNGADFTITQPNLPSGILAPNATTTFTISYTPSSVASGTNKVGSITISNNDLDENNYVINLQGTSTPAPAPDINVKLFNTPFLSGSTYDFGSVTENTNGNLIYFTIENLGAASLSLSGTPKIEISGTNSSEYSLTAFSIASVSAGSFTTFSIRFNPSLATNGNPRVATLTIPSNDPDEATYTINLTGTSIPPIPDIHVTTSDSTPIPYISGSSYAFGSTTVGVEIYKIFRIRNVGTKVLSLTGTPKVAITGTNASHFFVLTQPSNTPIGISSYQSISVYYVPIVGGSSSANLVIESDDPDEGTYTIQLSGTGVENTAPCFDISNFTPSLSNSALNFYGSGKTLYYSNFINISLGKQNPSAIIHMDQNHPYQTPEDDYRPILAYWYNSGTPTPISFRDNLGVTSSTTMVPRGRNTSFYSNSSVWSTSANFNYLPSVDNSTYRYDVNAPATSPSMTVNQVRACHTSTYQERYFNPISGFDNLSGLSHVWTTRKKMKIRLIYIDGSYNQQTVAGLQTAVDRMKAIYAQDTVKVDLEFTATVLNNSEYLTIAELSDDTATVTSSLSKLYKNTGSSQDANSLNIYITKDESQVGGVLGISSGIPGLPGITGTKKAGMIVFLEAHRSSGSVGDVLSNADQIFLGDTIAHEAGHFLGLYHLVERSGLNSADTSSLRYNQDTLIDTPTCSSSRDVNTNGVVDIDECLGTWFTNSGANNLMFWAGDGVTYQSQLTGEQGWIIRMNPLTY